MTSRQPLRSFASHRLTVQSVRFDRKASFPSFLRQHMERHGRHVISYSQSRFSERDLTLSPPIPLRLYALPYWSNPLFLIFDIRALWRPVLSARVPECQKLKTVGMALNPSNSSNLEQLTLKGLRHSCFPAHIPGVRTSSFDVYIFFHHL